jgi:hypothetical protein
VELDSSSTASSRICLPSSSKSSNSPDSHCALMNVEIIGASCLATGLPSHSYFSLMISFSSRVRAHPIWLVVNHRVVSSGWERRSVLISGMVYTTSPPHLSSPRPTYRGCAGDIRTPYIRLLHSTPSSSSSSDSDVTSLAATPCPWAARGRLSRGLGVFLIRLRTFLVIRAEARFASFPVTHRAHMACLQCFSPTIEHLHYPLSLGTVVVQGLYTLVAGICWDQPPSIQPPQLLHPLPVSGLWLSATGGAPALAGGRYLLGLMPPRLLFLPLYPSAS